MKKFPNWNVTKIVTRASESGRWLNCNASLYEAAEREIIDVENEFATQGTWIHEFIERGIRNGGTLEPGAGSALHALGFSPESIKRILILSNVGLKAWREDLAQYFVEPILEHKVALPAAAGVKQKVTGRVDVLNVAGDAVVVLDWKSGLNERGSDREQVRTYAALAFDENRHAEAYTILVYLATGDILVEKMDRPAIQRHRARIEAAVTQPPKYSAGAHCEFCPAASNCAALNDNLRGAVRMVLDLAEGESDKASIKSLCRHLPKIRMIKKMIEKAEVSIRATVAALGDEVKLTSGARARVLRNVQAVDGTFPAVTFSETKAPVTPDVLPVVRQFYRDRAPQIDPDDVQKAIEGAVKISGNGIESLARKIAPNRKGAEYARELKALLEEAGAYTYGTRATLGMIPANRVDDEEGE